MDRVTNHRSMWGMVRASRLGDISEHGLVGDSPVFLTSPRQLTNISTMASSSSVTTPRSHTQRARRTGHIQNQEVTPFPQYFNANEHVVRLDIFHCWRRMTNPSFSTLVAGRVRTPLGSTSLSGRTHPSNPRLLRHAKVGLHFGHRLRWASQVGAPRHITPVPTGFLELQFGLHPSHR